MKPLKVKNVDGVLTKIKQSESEWQECRLNQELLLNQVICRAKHLEGLQSVKELGWGF